MGSRRCESSVLLWMRHILWFAGASIARTALWSRLADSPTGVAQRAAQPGLLRFPCFALMLAANHCWVSIPIQRSCSWVVTLGATIALNQLIALRLSQLFSVDSYIVCFVLHLAFSDLHQLKAERLAQQLTLCVFQVLTTAMAFQSPDDWHHFSSWYTCTILAQDELDFKLAHLAHFAEADLYQQNNSTLSCVSIMCLCQRSIAFSSGISAV